jgi:adenosylhomocysteine nucleosidase
MPSDSRAEEASPAGEEARARGRCGVLSALPEELGSLRERSAQRRRVAGLEVLEVECGGERVLACAGGIGKVNAAHAASVLIQEGATRALLIVGVCGGPRQFLAPGELVHCTVAVQTDFASRSERERASDPLLRAAWKAIAPGHEGWFLTADRPVLSLWRRLRLANAFSGPCVADMETAAAAAVAARAGVPWASLRAVTDRATSAGLVSFRAHFPVQAGRCADTVPQLLARLGVGGGT